MINDVKGEFEVLREGRTVPSDNMDLKHLTKKWRRRECGVVLGNETSRRKMNLYGGRSSFRISIEKKNVSQVLHVRAEYTYLYVKFQFTRILTCFASSSQ